MNTEEMIARLESVSLPDLALEDHRRELRASLMAEYARVQFGMGLSGWLARLRLRPVVWKTALVTSAVWVLIVIALVVSTVIPAQQPFSGTAQTVNAVMSHPLVRAAMAGDQAAEVTVTSLGGDMMEVLIRGGGGIIIARANVKGSNVTILEIKYVILFGSGSMYGPREAIAGEELDALITVAAGDPTFRDLIDKGAVVSSAEVMQTLVSRRDLVSGETTESREEWATVALDLDGERWSFLIDPGGSRVMHLGTRPVR